MDPKINRRCLKRIFNEWERLDQKRYVIPPSDTNQSPLNRVVIIQKVGIIKRLHSTSAVARKFDAGRRGRLKFENFSDCD